MGKTSAGIHSGNNPPSTRAFNFDSAANINVKNADGIVRNYLTSAEHQYVSDGVDQFEYDGNGNLTHHVSAGVDRKFSYDYMNRLMHAEVTVGAETTEVDFKYDALGRRVLRSSGSSVTKYIYEGSQVVQELDAFDAVVREYIWGDSIDELLGFRQGGVSYTVHENSIGSVSAITNSSGALIERYDYDVFGLPYVTDLNNDTPPDPTTSFLGQPYFFQGREWDPVLRMFYFRARYYDPALGRFISQDPEVYADGPNLYSAFGNSAINSVDPLGTDEYSYAKQKQRRCEANPSADGCTAEGAPFMSGIVKGSYESNFSMTPPFGAVYQMYELRKGLMQSYDQHGVEGVKKFLKQIGIGLVPIWNAVEACNRSSNLYHELSDYEGAGEAFVDCLLNTAGSAMFVVGIKRGFSRPNGLKTPTSLLDEIISDANRVAAKGGEIGDRQASIIRQNLPEVQRRNSYQTRVLRQEFTRDSAAIIAEWERNTGRVWPNGATPYHVIPLESGGANKWWNIMPTYSKLPNHSLPGIPGPHARNSSLRQTIQRGRRALPPGTVTDLRKK